MSTSFLCLIGYMAIFIRNNSLLSDCLCQINAFSVTVKIMQPCLKTAIYIYVHVSIIVTGSGLIIPFEGKKSKMQRIQASEFSFVLKSKQVPQGRRHRAVVTLASPFLLGVALNGVLILITVMLPVEQSYEA